MWKLQVLGSSERMGKFITTEFWKVHKEEYTSNSYTPLIIILVEASKNRPALVKTWWAIVSSRAHQYNVYLCI